MHFFLNRCLFAFRFLDSHRGVFSALPTFAFTGHSEDDVKKVSLTHPQLHREMGTRCKEMKLTMHQMTADQEEVSYRFYVFIVCLTV